MIAADNRTVDFDATAISYSYISSDGKLNKINFTEPSRTNTYKEMMDAFTGTERDKQLYSQVLIQNGIRDEIEVAGNFGATLRPSNQQEPYPGGQISPSVNFQVFVNPFLTDQEKAKNVGHELFGHLYFYFIGKDPRHGGTTKTVVGNIELENHINSSLKIRQT